MTDISSLSNNILIAMPGLNESEFERSVIYVCEHKPEGAVGLIINQPLVYPMSIIFEQLEITPNHPDKNQEPLLYGGPLQPERGFVLHKQMKKNWRSSLLITNEVTITTSNDIISAIAYDKGPKDAIITLGYSGWNEYQLEKEVTNNLWLVCPFKPELLYEIPFEKRWQYAGSLIGVDMNKLSSQVGHG